MDDAFASIGKRIPWLPDETIFSWCSRYHLLAANGLADATALQLFGRRRHCVAHDLPSRLAELVERADGSLGSVCTVIRERTLLPFYAPFRPQHLHDQAMLGMSGQGIGHLKYQLGLLTSGLGAAHPLKACPDCLREDRMQRSVGYWRRAHQLPGVWVCPTHGGPLLVSSLKLEQRARYQFCLPVETGLTAWPLARGQLDRGVALEVCQKLGRFSVDLCELEPGRLADPAAVAAAFLHGMSKRGWVTASGRVAWRKFQDALRGHAEAMGLLPPMAMQVDAAIARAQCVRILSGRALTHPLRYLAWMTLMFDGLEEFVAAYESAAASPSSLPFEVAQTLPAEDSRRQQVISRFRSGQGTATSLAKQYGVDPSTIAAWLARSGIAAPRRAKIMDEGKCALATSLLRAGCDKHVVAAQVGVSEVTITRELRRVPGLQACWHETRRERARASARAAWSQVAVAVDVLGVAAARRAEPAAYAWLYRNDRHWLQVQCEAEMVSRKVGANSIVRRERADARYAVSLRRAIADPALGAVGVVRDVERWAIVAPGLKRVLKRPQDWPQTIAVLQRVLWSPKLGTAGNLELLG